MHVHTHTRTHNLSYTRFYSVLDFKADTLIYSLFPGLRLFYNNKIYKKLKHTII